jgi:hypothetical protein
LVPRPQGGTCSLTDGNWTAVPTSGYEPWATARRDLGRSVIFSQGQATLQPTATIMNGDVDLVTYWYTLGMLDQFVK